MREKIFNWLFPVQFPMSHTEAIVSAVAAALTIIANAWISHYVLPPEYQVFLAASMGASTILAMLDYRSVMAQPWAILGGHLVAAVVGIFAAIFIQETVMAAAAALALTILAQLVLRCLHAPGGGTALLPVLGSVAIIEEGFGFVLVVVLNSVVLIVFALIFNNLHPNRRYPIPPAAAAPAPARLYSEDELEDTVGALTQELGIEPDELERISQRAVAHLRRDKMGAPGPGKADRQPSDQAG